MNIRNIFLFIIIFAITNCGFQPIHLSKNTSDFSINEIEEKGDKTINRKILSKTNLSKMNEAKVKYNLLISSLKKNEIISKDASGNPLTYKISIRVKMILSNLEDPNIIFKQKIFNSSFNYNEKESKFSLSQYVGIIESNLIDKISKDIRIFLNN
tara:strand:- start:765 stop:1229 length:465 start_codon:yes stop_codon:yes gene_type:complete